MSYLLGLDISTACTGWCVLDSTGNFVEMGYVPLSKIKSPFQKAQKVLNTFLDLNIRYEIRQIAIEENLQAFRPGFSSAKTLLVLARFNGILSYICELIFRSEPIFINVNSARKNIGIKVLSRAKCGKYAKEQVFDWVHKELEQISFEWPVKILKSGPRKGKQVFEDGCYDMADAYVIARAAVNN